MIKKYILKYFNNKKYLEFKSLQKIEKSKKIFKDNFEKKIYKIHNSIKEKGKLNFLHSGNLGDLIYCLPV